MLFRSFHHADSTHPILQSTTGSANSMCDTSKASGVKFKSKSNTTSFLDINFYINVLEIQSIIVDEFTSTLLINCVALEQTLQNTSKYFSDYVYFMGCLVNKPKDAELLCSDGIITKYSQDDKYVADLFNSLGQKIGSISRDSVLYKQARNIELFYACPVAVYKRKYFSDPVSSISFYASLIIILTLVQTVMAVLSFIPRKGNFFITSKLRLLYMIMLISKVFHFIHLHKYWVSRYICYFSILFLVQS